MAQFQPAPGKWLHNAIMGALKGRGHSLASWCDENDVGRQTIRTYTYGLNSGPNSDAVLQKLINDAGRETVISMYKRELLEQAVEAKADAA